MFKECCFMENIKWELAHTCNTDFEAHHIKANLTGAGISCEILSQVDTTRMFTMGELAIVKLFVPADDLDLAKEIIEAIANNEDELSDVDLKEDEEE